MNTFTRVLCVAALVGTGTAPAQEPAGHSTPIGWYVAPLYAYTDSDPERLADDGNGGLLAIGHRGERAAIELEGVYSKLGSGDTTLTGGELALLVGAPFENKWLARIHGVLGLGVLREKEVPAVANKDRGSVIGEVGLAYLVPFELFGLALDLRGEARLRYDYLSPPHNSSPSHFLEPVYAIGLQFALSRAAAPVPPPPAEEIKVVEPPIVEAPPPAPEPAPVEKPSPQPEFITLDTAKAGDVVVLSGVNFDSAQATLTANAKTILDGVAETLLTRQDLRVEIGGHTDSRGDNAYNQDLSERRAQSVREYLTGRGVKGDRMTAVGYGEDQPVDSNETRTGREKNRRVEMKVLPPLP